MFIQNRIQKLLNNTSFSVCCIVSDFESSTNPATNLIVAGSVGCSLGKGGIFVWHGCRPPRGPLSRRDGSREKKGAVATWATRHCRCASGYPVCPSARGQLLSETPPGVRTALSGRGVVLPYTIRHTVSATQSDHGTQHEDLSYYL